MAPFHCDVHRTQNPIKIETDENKLSQNQTQTSKLHQNLHILQLLKKEVAVVEIL